MRIVLLCGGAGKRLWPLSNDIRSKLFLRLLPAPDGQQESMLGRVYRQLILAGLDSSALLLAHRSQVNLAFRHTEGRLPVLGEPAKRGTFTAAALAAAYFHTRGMGLDEVLCIAPADMFAGDDFFHSIAALSGLLLESGADLAMLGTRPTHASDQYGYVVPGLQMRQEGKSAYAQVARFTEKPDLSGAQQLINQGALWNCGIYAFTLRYMLSCMEQSQLPLNDKELCAMYDSLPVRSFDEEIAERTERAVVLPYEGEWHDIGNWQTLTEQLGSRVIGRGQISGQTHGTHIVNELPYPLHVIGVEDIIAAASLDGILIASKSHAHAIKEQLGKLQLHPMHGETSWGSYRVLDEFEHRSPNDILAIRLTVLPDHRLNGRIHGSGLKVWTIVSGRGEVMLNGERFAAASGSVFSIPVDTYHTIRADLDSKLELIEVRLGNSLVSAFYKSDSCNTEL
ncbi:mannose-1-phosphate guanylyltransferase [Paenibacillus polymyxa]|uniref:Mannose-1-phosphate guanylyltransferase n=1 Tax=Paenibacillus polymyxa TaxID=1406 RepID=A0A378XX33_PAEPO|nr:sugar phosphate nucleotidyltransferase [Paenibacillus polymyxa]MBE7899966.1 mannose-1-phosphate guanylyltransferase [Paenibacillus polymyxa]MBG9764633.1 mannose-1-phosphate guanylyltransferase [Paenibacillus polymyxa]MCC3259635.1 mannose-1-phosphate guanylyltransferase [Paenibacillus polymyxa]QPK55399.1 mannose-1-phosphate guanylyltransferase [Paenibacillus polymyxa]QPK60485.1 mannose-1-phosphate guanylyltransferase [Paenibacillus polymyxa]